MKWIGRECEKYLLKAAEPHSFQITESRWKYKSDVLCLPVAKTDQVPVRWPPGRLFHRVDGVHGIFIGTVDTRPVIITNGYQKPERNKKSLVYLRRARRGYFPLRFKSARRMLQIML